LNGLLKNSRQSMPLWKIQELLSIKIETRQLVVVYLFFTTWFVYLNYIAPAPILVIRVVNTLDMNINGLIRQYQGSKS